MKSGTSNGGRGSEKQEEDTREIVRDVNINKAQKTHSNLLFKLLNKFRTAVFAGFFVSPILLKIVLVSLAVAIYIFVSLYLNRIRSDAR